MGPVKLGTGSAVCFSVILGLSRQAASEQRC